MECKQQISILFFSPVSSTFLRRCPFINGFIRGPNTVYFPWWHNTELVHSPGLAITDKRRQFLGKKEKEQVMCWTVLYNRYAYYMCDYALNFLSEILLKLQFFCWDLLLFWSRSIKEVMWWCWVEVFVFAWFKSKDCTGRE